MNFFGHQDRARARSARLLLLFCLAIAAIVVLVNVGAVVLWRVLFGALPTPQYFMPTNAFVVVLIVGGSAWLERMRLGASGHALAERLGARPLGTTEPLDRRFRDVAEELAVAAGVPVPGLYVLDEASINALAAGERPAVAAIVVTRGALERLDRAQLQGVVAHEYAHILGGDAVLNVRLTSALYGLYALRLLGGHLLDWALGRTGRESASGLRLLAPLAIPAGLLVSALGLLGVVAAQLLRAGISREREFLADAVAVQLTRDRDGLGGALRRIGTDRLTRSRVRPAAGDDYLQLVSHFMMVQPRGASDWFDSHPSLSERIRRLYGTSSEQDRQLRALSRLWLPARVDPVYGSLPSRDGAPMSYLQMLTEAPTELLRWVDTIELPKGERSPPTLLLDTRAGPLIARLREPGLRRIDAARWLVALVCGRRSDEARDTPDERALQWLLAADGAALRVPVLELMLARMRSWSVRHRRALLERCRREIEADGRVESAEWVHYTLARHRLLPAAGSHRPAGVAASLAGDGKLACSQALATLFAMAASVGEASARTTRDRLAETAAMLRIPAPASTPDEVDADRLTRALDVLEALPPLDKPLLLKMLERMARTPADPAFTAFVRAVAAAIDCPVPRRMGTDVFGIAA